MAEQLFDESDFGKALAGVKSDLVNLKSVLAARQNRPIRSSRSLRKNRPLRISDLSRKSSEELVFAVNSIRPSIIVVLSRRRAERDGWIIIGPVK